MKKRLLSVLLAFCLFAAASLTAFAGGINGPESAVLGAASGTFEYEGRTYVVAQPYLGMLAAKLSEDGIDLTDTQASALISQAYGMIGDGVAGGYLVPIDGGESSGTEQSETAEAEIGQTEGLQTEGLQTEEASETELWTEYPEEDPEEEQKTSEVSDDETKGETIADISGPNFRLAIWKGMQIFLQPFWKKTIQFVLGIFR